MNSKQRDVVLRRWRSVILRETRDLAWLKRVGARALHDRDVRADATLESLIRGHLQQYRGEIERDPQSVVSANRQSHPEVQPAPPPSIPPPPPEPVQAEIDRLVKTLNGWLARGFESEARAVCKQMRALQEESRGGIPATALQPCEQQVARLRTRLEEFKVQIAALVQQATTASRNGDEQAAAESMRRLSAIHVTYPHLLDETRLDEIRADIVHANEEHEDGLMMRKLVERERAVATDLVPIAAAVREFHRVVCAVPGLERGVRRC